MSKRYIIVTDVRMNIIIIYKDLEFQKNTPRLFIEKNKIITYLNYSHDEKYICVGEFGGAFYIFNLET
jgi:hypothetical protein